MKPGILFFLSASALFLITNCSNIDGNLSCRNNCSGTSNLCYMALLGSNTNTLTNVTSCEVYKASCINKCEKPGKGSSSKSSSGSRSSGSSRSSSGGSSSGGSSGGSGGSSHSILADSGNEEVKEPQ